MSVELLVWIALAMAVAGALYSSVGHGGASAYLAIMGLLAVSPEVMRPTALTLNVVVSGWAAFNFSRQGEINWRLLGAFALSAVPAAFLGGSIHLTAEIYRPVVGILLLAAALRLFWQPKRLANREIEAPPLMLSLPVGAGLGLLAGLTGTGGGIFLSPLIILFGWESPRRTSGVAAAFIFMNSVAGLLGNIQLMSKLPPQLPVLVGAVAAGAILGTWLGVSKLPRERLLQALGVVLLIAGLKMLLQ